MDPRIKKMADVIINFSLDVKAGELVLLRSTGPGSDEFVKALYQSALTAGAEAYTYVHVEDEDALAIEATQNPDLLSAPNPMLKLMYEQADAIVRIDSPANLRALSSYPLELQAARSKGKSAILNIQMRREGTGDLRRCTTLFPTQPLAQVAGMSYMQYEEFVFNACKLHLDDPVAAWKALEAEQAKLIDFLDGKKHMQVRGENIDLELSFEGRKFINASGKSNFPDGEIFTGPVENSVNGWVKFTYPAYYNNNEITGIELKFEDGKVTEAKADRNEALLNAVLDTDAGSRYLGEFAIGNNRDIQQFTGSILFDEKIAGTIHMAVGQGYPKSGSKNNSGIHWDMICDMRSGGEILVDGELFYKDGEFQV